MIFDCSLYHSLYNFSSLPLISDIKINNNLIESSIVKVKFEIHTNIEKLFDRNLL